MTAAELTTLLGWAAVLNIGYLCLATFALMFMRGLILRVHQWFLPLDKTTMILKYFDFVSHYKIVTLVFCVMPYLALKIMGY